MIKKIFKTGHSLAVTLASSQLKELGLKMGDSVTVDLDKASGCIVVRPGNKPSQLVLDLKTRPVLGQSRIEQNLKN